MDLNFSNKSESRLPLHWRRKRDVHIPLHSNLRRSLPFSPDEVGLTQRLARRFGLRYVIDEALEDCEETAILVYNWLLRGKYGLVNRALVAPHQFTARSRLDEIQQAGFILIRFNQNNVSLLSSVQLNNSRTICMTKQNTASGTGNKRSSQYCHGCIIVPGEPVN